MWNDAGAAWGLFLNSAIAPSRSHPNYIIFFVYTVVILYRKLSFIDQYDIFNIDILF